jgi:putative transposase
MRRLIFSKVTANWRAGSKKFGSPVRREGQSLPLSLPLSPPQKSRPVGYGVIRAGVRTDSMIGVTTGIAQQNGMIPKCIGGVSDHVHLLVTLPTRLAVAKAVQLIKAGSSAWIHQTFPNLRNFAWQQGYGAFSVGISQVQETVHYIEQQLEHHRTRTFQEEYLAFLKKHGAHFDEKYLWD